MYSLDYVNKQECYEYTYSCKPVLSFGSGGSCGRRQVQMATQKESVRGVMVSQMLISVLLDLVAE